MCNKYVAFCSMDTICLKTGTCIVVSNLVLSFNFTVIYELCKRVQNKNVGQIHTIIFIGQ